MKLGEARGVGEHVYAYLQAERQAGDLNKNGLLVNDAGVISIDADLDRSGETASTWTSSRR